MSKQESAAICDACMTALDGIPRYRPMCREVCPLHETCERCGNETNGRRVLIHAEEGSGGEG